MPELTVLLSHGNAQDLAYLRELVGTLHRRLSIPVQFLAYEYPGYSLSNLPVSEQMCLYAAEGAYIYAREELGIPPERIVAWGISLGTGPAVHMAAQFPVARLILQSPYTSIAATVVGESCAKRLRCMDLLRSREKAEQINCEVLLYHGDRDNVVPPENSTELAALLREVDGPHFYAGAGHNDLLFPGMGIRYHGSCKDPYSMIDDFLGKAMLDAHDQSARGEQEPVELNNDVRGTELAT